MRVHLNVNAYVTYSLCQRRRTIVIDGTAFKPQLTCMIVHAHVYAHMCVCISAHVYAHMCVYVSAHVYAHVHMQVHAHYLFR
mgnify:CR=1 FL=1